MGDAFASALLPSFLTELRQRLPHIGGQAASAHVELHDPALPVRGGYSGRDQFGDGSDARVGEQVGELPGRLVASWLPLVYLVAMRGTMLVALLVCCAAGCGAPQSKVVKTASFDHDCPEANIRVLEENRDIWAYKLDVCGQVRKYRDRGNEKEFQFVDVTDDPAAGSTLQ